MSISNYDIVKNFSNGWVVLYDNNTHILTLPTVKNLIAINKFGPEMREEYNSIGLKMRLEFSVVEGFYTNEYLGVRNALIFPTKELAQSALDWIFSIKVMNEITKDLKQ
jgi:hypothetical protein